MNTEIHDSTSHDSVADLSNRVIVFRELTVDQISNSVNSMIFEKLLDSHYTEYIKMCNYLKKHQSEVISVSCYIEEDKLYFDIKNK